MLKRLIILILAFDNDNNDNRKLRNLYHDDDNTKGSIYTKTNSNSVHSNNNNNINHNDNNNNNDNNDNNNNNNNNNNNGKDKIPCEFINENNVNSEVSSLSPAAMMSEPSFFSASLFESCHINHFINPLNIISTVPSTSPPSYLWIAYVGDSLFRSPFLLLSSLLSGYTIKDVNDESYFLGNRFKKKHDMSTDGGTWSASETNKIHLDHVICCSHPNMPYNEYLDIVGDKSVDYSNFCTVGIKTIDYDVDSIEFISHLIGEHGTCISWHWAPFINMARTAISGIFVDGHINPQAVFINSGLHEIWNGGEWEKYNASSIHELLVDLRHDIDVIQKKHPKVAFFYQVPLGMTYTYPNYNINLEEYGRMVKEVWANAVATTRNNHVLDMFKASLQLFKVEGCSKGDGIHFNRKCVYSVLVTQWHLAWLKSLGLIDITDHIKPNSKNRKYLR